MAEWKLAHTLQVLSRMALDVSMRATISPGQWEPLVLNSFIVLKPLNVYSLDDEAKWPEYR